MEIRSVSKAVRVLGMLGEGVGAYGVSELARMVEMDLEYARNWSVGRDLWIILRTFVVVIRGRGAC